MLLINPDVHPDTQLEVIRPFIYRSFPTGLGYLAAYMRKKHGDKIIVCDDQINWLTEESLRVEINRMGQPKIAGITCLTVTAKRAREISRLIKKIDPEILVVFGGIHATAMPEECLTKFSADVVVRGEGEETLSEIYIAVKEKRVLGEISGISYVADGKIIHNPLRNKLIDIEEIPPFPYDLFGKNINYYKDFGTIISSRGCPFNCIFCSQRLITKQKYRFLPTSRVISKIKLLVDKYHQDKIFFVDDTFTINKERVFNLLNAIIDLGYHKKVGFIVLARGRDITKELLSKMKEANVISIAYGAETGSERLMKTIDKGETVEDVAQAIKMTNEAGIDADASFIMGLPSETKKERKLSDKFARSLPLNGARFNIAIPYPGTKLYEIAEQEGRLNVADDWINFSNQHYLSSRNIPYTPFGTDKDELIYDTFVANLKFTFRPRMLAKILFGSSSGGAILSVPNKWYLSPRLCFSLFQVLIFLMKKAVIILARRAILASFKLES